MKILFTNEAPLIKYGVAEGFRQLGHEVKIIAGDNERLWGQEPEEQQKRFLSALEFNPDLVFSEGYSGMNVPLVGKILKTKNIPHFYWAIEDPVTTHIGDHFAQYSDFIFTTAEERVPHYINNFKKGSETLLFACNPEFHKNVEKNEDLTYDLVLVASNYSNRYKEAEWFIMSLLELDLNMKIWGVWWDDPTRPVNILKHSDKYGGLLPYELLPTVYSSAKIVLGMNCDDSSNTQTSMRPYETLGCGGGVFLAHYTKAQENLFGNLIYQVKNKQETLNTVKYLLSLSDESRKNIALQGQKFVYENHNYKQRAVQIINVFLNKFNKV